MSDYPLIRLWGAMLGSHEPYIKDQVEKARRDKAPQHAIYHTETARISTGKDTKGRYFHVAGTNGAWALWVANIPSDTREQILREAKRAGMDVEAIIALMARGNARTLDTREV